jgi:Na+/H+ antiporter
LENYSIIIFILAIMIGISAVSDRIRLPYPVLLVVVGIVVGFIPGVQKIQFDPEIVFLIFLPPMLYDSAFNISFKGFRTHINTIGTLSVALVFFTTIGIAVLSYYLVPGMTWPLSFTLGAILSATDAVAAMGITRNLRLPHKISTILEGESLINDASGLIAYRLAVAAVSGVTFVIWKAGLQFLFLLIGGCLIGIILGRLLSFILKYVHQNNSIVAISFTLLMPFVGYLLAEELHVSGVIAVVTIGMQISHFTKKEFPEATRQESKAIWDIIVFLLNGLIFILIGLELPYVIDHIDSQDLLPLVGYSFLICLVALTIRMARIFLQRVNLQKGFVKYKGRISEDALLDWKSCLVIGWSGMRGIVSLATALALPLTLPDGSPFPQRDTIVFISVVVVLITIVGQGLSLPMLVKWLKIDEDHASVRELQESKGLTLRKKGRNPRTR